MRDLQEETVTQSKNMALLFDIEKDILFQQGKEQQAILGIKTLLKLNLSHQNIADSLQVPLEFVEKVAKSMKK